MLDLTNVPHVGQLGELIAAAVDIDLSETAQHLNTLATTTESPEEIVVVGRLLKVCQLGLALSTASQGVVEGLAKVLLAENSSRAVDLLDNPTGQI